MVQLIISKTYHRMVFLSEFLMHFCTAFGLFCSAKQYLNSSPDSHVWVQTWLKTSRCPNLTKNKQAAPTATLNGRCSSGELGEYCWVVWFYGVIGLEVPMGLSISSIEDFFPVETESPGHRLTVNKIYQNM